MKKNPRLEEIRNQLYSNKIDEIEKVYGARLDMRREELEKIKEWIDGFTDNEIEKLKLELKNLISRKEKLYTPYTSVDEFRTAFHKSIDNARIINDKDREFNTYTINTVNGDVKIDVPYNVPVSINASSSAITITTR